MKTFFLQMSYALYLVLLNSGSVVAQIKNQSFV